MDFFTVDIEVTNKCNAVCSFCPRDMTPHEGLMPPHVFEKALFRAVEYRDFIEPRSNKEIRLSMCGLGEPLLNKNILSYVQKVKEAGFKLSISSNGAALNEKNSAALLDMGLDTLFINISDIHERYDAVYGLPFERTCENVLRFYKMAEDKCDVVFVLVDHHGDQNYTEELKTFWRDKGVQKFYSYRLINRGGSLKSVPSNHSAKYTQKAMQALTRDGVPAICSAPWFFQFIGYDGNYYLCSSDWEKKVSSGSIYSGSLMEAASQKLEHVFNRNAVCSGCTLDPLNELAAEMERKAKGQVVQDEAEALTDVLWARSDAAKKFMKPLLRYKAST